MNSPTIQAAKITLAALRSVQRENGPVREDVVLLDGRSIPISEAVRELASRPKILLCRSALSGNVLSISTTSVGSSADPRFHPGLEQIIREEQEYIRRSYANGHVARVLIIDGDATFVVDDTVLGVWEREYRLPGVAYRISDERPNNYVQAADAAVVFWPTAKDRPEISIQYSDQ